MVEFETVFVVLLLIGMPSLFCVGFYSTYESFPVDDNYTLPQSFIVNDVPFVFENGHIIHVTIPDGFVGRISIVDATRSVSLFSMNSNNMILYSKEMKQKEYFVDVMTGYGDKVAIEVENDKVYKSQIFKFETNHVRFVNSTFVGYITGHTLAEKITILPVNKGY